MQTYARAHARSEVIYNSRGVKRREIARVENSPRLGNRIRIHSGIERIEDPCYKALHFTRLVRRLGQFHTLTREFSIGMKAHV